MGDKSLCGALWTVLMVLCRLGIVCGMLRGFRNRFDIVCSMNSSKVMVDFVDLA